MLAACDHCFKTIPEKYTIAFCASFYCYFSVPLNRCCSKSTGLIFRSVMVIFVCNVEASTPGSSAVPEGHEFRGDRDQSRDVLVRDEAINCGPGAMNNRVS